MKKIKKLECVEFINTCSCPESYDICNWINWKIVWDIRLYDWKLTAWLENWSFKFEFDFNEEYKWMFEDEEERELYLMKIAEQIVEEDWLIKF